MLGASLDRDTVMSSSSSKKPEAELVASARAFETELERYEAAIAQLTSGPVNSEKTLQRTARALEACAAHEGTLAVHLQAFAAAMQDAQSRQQRCMEATAEATSRIKARFD